MLLPQVLHFLLLGIYEIPLDCLAEIQTLHLLHIVKRDHYTGPKYKKEDIILIIHCICKFRIYGKLTLYY